jgi:heme/copper-type cytochrome/quinol oxidase subunit 2
MNIPLFFISIFLIFTLILSPVGIILMYVSFKLNKKDKEPEYKMNTYDEEMLEDMR